MKKSICFLLTFVMVIMFAGCGAKQQDDIQLVQQIPGGVEEIEDETPTPEEEEELGDVAPIMVENEMYEVPVEVMREWMNEDGPSDLLEPETVYPDGGSGEGYSSVMFEDKYSASFDGVYSRAGILESTGLIVMFDVNGKFIMDLAFNEGSFDFVTITGEAHGLVAVRPVEKEPEVSEDGVETHYGVQYLEILGDLNNFSVHHQNKTTQASSVVDSEPGDRMARIGIKDTGVLYFAD